MWFDKAQHLTYFINLLEAADFLYNDQIDANDKSDAFVEVFLGIVTKVFPEELLIYTLVTKRKIKHWLISEGVKEGENLRMLRQQYKMSNDKNLYNVYKD